MHKIFCRHRNYPLKFVRNLYGDQVYMLNARSVWQCRECGKLFFRNYLYEPGKISDGYHTFDELYHHRAVLFSVICNSHPDISWKSLQHDDPNEPMYNGMFIVGIETPEGQATYHYNIKPYWDMFKVKEIERAPKWDGHTPDEAIRRIGLLK